MLCIKSVCLSQLKARYVHGDQGDTTSASFWASKNPGVHSTSMQFAVFLTSL